MNKNKKYIILLFCLLISSCTFFTQYGRDYKRAHNQYIESDYDKAIQYCIKSLKRKPDFKKSLKMYEELVPLAIESHHYNIEKYSNSPNSPDKLVEQFEKLFSLIRSLKEARISKSYELYIKSDYSKEYNIALENAASHHYNKGIDLMSYNEKRKYKAAYNEFILANNYKENYKKVKDYIKECKENSIFHITIMDFENNANSQYNNLGNSISNKLVSDLSKTSSFSDFVNIVDRKKIESIIEQFKLSSSGLVDAPQNELGKIKDIDHMITGDINKIIINEPNHTYDRIKIQHQIQIGEETIINADSTETTQPIYGTYSKYIKKHQIEASVSIELFLEIIDVETSEIINSEIFNSEISYTDKWTTGLEGIDPVDHTIRLLKNNTTKKSDPSIEEMLQKATNKVNHKMKNHLIKFYN
tara:strand:+ start:898 stop:2142 length:1245 start_codon:yes stop_codon:yes gene_type:complete